MKDIVLELESKNISPHSQIKGKISVTYPGRYDGVVINTQILNSNQLVTYKSYNGKQISENHSRLFISKDTMSNNVAEFTASIDYDFDESHEIKFRASIIEQHKEIESDVQFAKLSV